MNSCRLKPFLSILLVMAFASGSCNGPIGGTSKMLELEDIEGALEEGVALVDIEQIFNDYYKRGIAQSEVDAVSTELNERLNLARQVLATLLQEINAERDAIEDLPEEEKNSAQKLLKHNNWLSAFKRPVNNIKPPLRSIPQR
ncbi:MAG: hypothetical protein ACFCU3_08435 [Verrucomicrobiales bacterium]